MHIFETWKNFVPGELVKIVSEYMSDPLFELEVFKMQLKKILRKRFNPENYEFILEEGSRYYFCVINWMDNLSLSRYDIFGMNDPEISLNDVSENVRERVFEYISDPLFEIEYERFKRSF